MAKQPLFGMTDVITLLVKENPRRPGTNRAKRFDLYKDGMTVKEALDKGVLRGGIRKDVAQKYIAIKAGKVAAKPTKPAATTKAGKTAAPPATKSGKTAAPPATAGNKPAAKSTGKKAA